MNQIKQLTKIMNCAKLCHAMNIDRHHMDWMMYGVQNEIQYIQEHSIQHKSYMLKIYQSGYINWDCYL